MKSGLAKQLLTRIEREHLEVEAKADHQEAHRMGVATFEGVVEQVRIHLKTSIRPPDNTKVYVIVPDVHIERSAYIFSPRLVHPEQSSDFELEVVEESPDDSI